MKREVLLDSLDYINDEYIAQVTEHIAQTFSARSGIKAFWKPAAVAVCAFLAIGITAFGVINVLSGGRGREYPVSGGTVSVPQTQSFVPDDSGSVSEESSETSVGYEELIGKSGFLADVADIGFTVGNTSQLFEDDMYFGGWPAYYYDDEEAGTEYFYPYAVKIYEAENFIAKYVEKNIAESADEVQKYYDQLPSDSDGLDAFSSPWGMIKYFGLEYDELAPKLAESGIEGLTDEDIRLFFEGTPEECADKFLSKFTIYENGVVFTPKRWLLKSFDDMAKAAVLPAILEEKAAAVREFLPDAEWAEPAENTAEMYAYVWEAAANDFNSKEKFELERFLKKYEPQLLEKVYDEKHFNEEIVPAKLTEEQKDVVTEVYEKYTELAYIFFNRNFEIKDLTERFKGTEYEFERVILDKDDLPDELVEACDGHYPQNFIKYTGSAVNTEEKLDAEMRKYFTEDFIESLFKVNYIEGDSLPEMAYYYRWEEDGAVYRNCPEGGMTLPLGDEINVYVTDYIETDTSVTIKTALDESEIFISPTNSYDYVHAEITLERGENGELRMSGYKSDRSDETLINEFYQKGTLHLD